MACARNRGARAFSTGNLFEFVLCQFFAFSAFLVAHNVFLFVRFGFIFYSRFFLILNSPGSLTRALAQAVPRKCKKISLEAEHKTAAKSSFFVLPAQIHRAAKRPLFPSTFR